MPKREYPRKRVTFTSEMIFDKGEMPCSIKNISAGGAKLKATGKPKNEYPQKAVLDITPYGRFKVTIVWRSEEYFGVQFFDDPAKMTEVLIAMAVY